MKKLSTRNLLMASGLLLLQSQAQAGLTVYDDMLLYLADTGATAAAPLPDIGLVPPGDATASLSVGDLTYSISAPGSTSFFSGGASWTTAISGNTIAIGGSENLNVDLANGIYAFGFEFVEPSDSPSFVDSTFSVTLFDGLTTIDSFTFNAANDVAAFVGVWADVQFDRVEIKEIVGAGENEFFGQFYTGPTTSGSAVVTPIPPAAMLFATSLFGLVFAGRRSAG